MKRVAMVIACLAVLGALRSGRLAAQERDDARAYRVIVNAENPEALLSALEVSRLFLRKTAKWSHNGEAVLPVELGQDSPVRAAFIRDVHRKNPMDVTVYWEEQVFQGKTPPPPDESSDGDVIDYVRAHANAIGYVSAGAKLTPDVKPVTITR
jgi:ABC-type phosphate transport system substrate-binding protein